MTAATPAIRVENAACWFDVSPSLITRIVNRRPRTILKALDGVSFEVRRGTTFGIVGESGCGKSTLARAIVGLNRPTHGSIAFPRPENGSTPRVQMIFQDPYSSLNPRWRVGEIIAEPIRELRLRRSEAETQARIGELLGLVGLAPRDAARFPHEFSGGQRQRISIARALATEADILVCDEPTSALDVSVQAQVLNLMKQLQAKLGLTYVLISHNLSVVRHMSDDLAIMYLGRIVETGPAEAIFRKPRHPYSRLLMDSIPDVETPNRNRIPLRGEVPSPLAPPSGCAFHPRCDVATPDCGIKAPTLRAFGNSPHVSCHLAEG